MADKISDYVPDATSNPIKGEDLMDFSNEDGGGGFDVSKKITVAEMMAYINANVESYYNGSGSLDGTRKVTANGNLTIWDDGYLQILKGLGTPLAVIDAATYNENSSVADLAANIYGSFSNSLLNDQTVSNSTDKVIGQGNFASWLQTTVGQSLTQLFSAGPQMIASTGTSQTFGSEGTVTYATGVKGTAGTSLGTTMTHASGFFSNLLEVNAGTVTNWYGYHMPDLSTTGTTRPGSTNRWGLYIEDDSQNHLKGNLSIGTLSTGAKLTVQALSNGTDKAVSVRNNTDTADLFTVRGDAKVGVNSPTPTGQFSVKSANNNGTTYPLYLENSNPTAVSRISDQGNMYLLGNLNLVNNSVPDFNIIQLLNSNYNIGVVTSPANGMQFRAGNLILKANEGGLGATFGRVLFTDKSDNIKATFNSETGSFGIGIVPTAKLHVQALSNGTDKALTVRNDTDTADLFTVLGNGNVGFGTETPDASAILDIDSTTQGVLMPRMTGVEVLAITGVDGLIVYATATSGAISSVGFWGYEAGAWVKL